MDENACVCPVCGKEIGPELVEVEEFPNDYDVARAVCPRCGHESSWLQ